MGHNDKDRLNAINSTRQLEDTQASRLARFEVVQDTPDELIVY